jgi:hypothetical protein
MEAAAHSLEQSYVYLDLNTEVVHGRIEIMIADLNRALDLDLPVDGSLSPADIEPYRQLITAYFRDRFVIHPDGEPGVPVFGQFGFLTLPQGQFLLTEFVVEGFRGEVEFIDVEYSVLFDRDPDHRAFLIIENRWQSGTFNNEAGISLVFEPGQTRQTLDLTGPGTLTGIWGMVRMGVHHIWIGLDHILFLIALLLPSVLVRRDMGWEPVASFRPALIYVLKIVTLFTVAHTITLSLATLTRIPLSPRIVESIIALSIAVAALDSLYPLFHKRIWWVVFAFGLFHGFGFASVLGDLGIPPQYTVYSLLAFNIGVELGQLAIVVVVFPLLYAMRNTVFYHKVVLRLGTLALIAISLYWFVERGFLIDLPVDENFWWALKKYGIYG